MNPATSDATNLLDLLIRLCREVGHASGVAAGQVHDPEVRAVLETGIDEHAAHARELEECRGAKRIGEGVAVIAPPRDPCWPDLAQAMARRDEYAILTACARAELKLLAALMRAAEDRELPPQSAETIREQAESVATRRSLLLACCDRAVPQEV